MQRIFLDTEYVIALEAADDQYHNPALRLLTLFLFLPRRQLFD